MADYPISNVARRVVYANTGVGPYAFTFEILTATDIAVYRGSTLLTLTTDYTVSINTNGTGDVTLVTAGTGNITIVGARAIQRTSDYTTGGDLFASTLNTDLDSQTIYVQQVAETAERGLKAPVVDPTDINMTLPSKTDRAGTFLAFDSPSGNPIAGPSIASVGTVTQNIANINAVAADIANVNTVATNINNVNTVAGISGNVTTVAGISANVTSVAGNATNINTVATNIANVNAVGNNIANVNSVAGNATNINTVATDLAGSNNIGTVAGSIADINALGPIAADIATVAGIDSDVTAVAGNATNINTVAGISSNVTTVAGISANVTAVAGNSTNINTVAGISGNVTTVATNNANVTTVAGSIASVNTNATNIANINQNAANIVAIQNASANATAAANSATAAASSATSASASAAAASAVALGNEPVRHSVRPSLLLDFANTKTLDPRITFTRGSTATFYDGKTVAKAEENLLTFSQEFDNAAWGQTSATRTANTEVAPDGTTTAETITAVAATSAHGIERVTQFGVVSGLTYTFSVFAKAGTETVVQLAAGNATQFGTTRFANFDLSAGTVGTVGADATATITSVGNSWYRCTITVTSIAAGTTGNCLIYLCGGDTARARLGSWTAVGTETIYVWGAQVEQRSSVTAYTATTTAPITNYIPALQTAASGVARFEHNPVTGESLGLEIEEQRTNLLLRSEEFQTTWTNTNSTEEVNVIVAPDGTLTGDRLVENTNNSTHLLNQDVTTTAVATTFSVYAKQGGRNWLVLKINDSGNTSRFAWFDLATGVVGTVQTNLTASITSVGNGWYRCAITVSTAYAGANGIRLYTANADNVTSYTGDGYSGIYIWGAQLEAGAFATSYIKTEGSQVTRSADSASMTGTNFSSWFNNSEGTFYGEFIPVTANYGENKNIFVASNNTQSNFVGIRYASTGTEPAMVSMVGGQFQANVLTGAMVANTAYKLAGTYKVNDFAVSRNSGTVGTDTSGTIPVVNRVDIGALDGVGIATTNIKKLAYYPKRLTNAELQGLTTV
jgi:hypothetical protein